MEMNSYKEYQDPLEKRRTIVTQLIRDVVWGIGDRAALSLVPSAPADGKDHDRQIRSALQALDYFHPEEADALHAIIETYDEVGYDDDIKVRKLYGGTAYYKAARANHPARRHK